MSGIVIIEGDDLIDSLLTEYLSEAGYQVCAAQSSLEQTQEPDLIIIDVYMPRGAGLRALSAARTLHPRTPLIAISGQFCSGLAGCGATAQRLGVERVIAKPFNRVDLLAAVRAVIGPPA
jgi:DNA-binding response OmpR family regulator